MPDDTTMDIFPKGTRGAMESYKFASADVVREIEKFRASGVVLPYDVWRAMDKLLEQIRKTEELLDAKR